MIYECGHVLFSRRTFSFITAKSTRSCECHEWVGLWRQFTNISIKELVKLLPKNIQSLKTNVFRNMHALSTHYSVHLFNCFHHANMYSVNIKAANQCFLTCRSGQVLENCQIIKLKHCDCDGHVYMYIVQWCQKVFTLGNECFGLRCVKHKVSYVCIYIY